MIFLTWEESPERVGDGFATLHAGAKKVGHVEVALNSDTYLARNHLDGSSNLGTLTICRAWLECSIAEWFDGAMATPQAKS